MIPPRDRDNRYGFSIHFCRDENAFFDELPDNTFL